MDANLLYNNNSNYVSFLLIRWKLIINRLIILQKRALRIVSKSWYDPQDLIFKEQKLLKWSKVLELSEC